MDQNDNPLGNIRRHLESLNIAHHELKSESYLHENCCLVCKSGAYFARIQKDGNFCVYVGSDFSPKNCLWSSKTHGKGKSPFTLSLQTDGNLVLYDKDQRPIWNTATADKGMGPYKLRILENGNLTLCDSEEEILWESHTDKIKHK